MPALNNSYLDCRLVDVGRDEGHHGPFIITQAGYDPEDLHMQESVFYLRRDGLWIDEIAQISRPDEERMLILYESAEDAAKALERLGGMPLVMRYALSRTDIRARIAELRSGAGYTVRFGQLAALFREAMRSERV